MYPIFPRQGIPPKDSTNYRSDYWDGYTKEEKASYTIEQFESDFFGADIEIEPFWNIFNKLNKTQLEPFGFLKRRGKDLQDLLFEIEDEINDERPYLFLDNEFKEKLFKENCFDIVSFTTDTEKQNYIRNAEDQIRTTTLRELAKKNELKSSLKRDDLIEQFHLNNIDMNLPKPILTNNNFEKMLLKFANLYIEDIKNSINEWHPLYFDEVWETVANESEFELVEQKAKEIITNKYWKDRLI